MSETLENMTAALLEQARLAGADAADAIAVSGTSLAIDVRGGALEQAERSEGTDLGLRVLVGRRQAVVSASDASAETIARMAERAVAMAREAPEDPAVGLADPAQLARERDASALEMADPAPEPAPSALQEAALAAEAAALGVEGVSQVDSAAAAYSRDLVHVAASNGFSGGYERTASQIYCVAITGSGTEMERDHFGEMATFAADLPAPEDVGRIAARRAVARAGARKPPTGAFPVLYDERVASSLIGHLLRAVNGQSVARGSSWARDLLGDRILPEGLSLIEEPHRRRGPRSRLWDAEGLPTAERAIIENGVLTGWTLDLATGRKLGMASTANAVRGPSSPPAPANWNLALRGGGMARDALLREMGTGLLVTSLIGSTINPTTGDYSRGAMGFWVEGGEIAYPVNECTLAGNLREMLGTLVPADDAPPLRAWQVPSLLVEGLTIAGE